MHKRLKQNWLFEIKLQRSKFYPLKYGIKLGNVYCTSNDSLLVRSWGISEKDALAKTIWATFSAEAEKHTEGDRYPEENDPGYHAPYDASTTINN